MPHLVPVKRRELLKSRLDALVETFDISTITPDPLELVLRYSTPRDQEVAGLLAAAFAYGRADTVVAHVGSVLAEMGPSPHAWLESFDRRTAKERFKNFSHRFHKAPDLAALLEAMALAIRAHGSIGEQFRAVYDPRESDIGPTLDRFAAQLLARVACAPAQQKALRYLITSPADGSACKRMNLFLRWMVRRTSPDLGIWTFVDPSKLVMPIDTHIHRITTFLGLNRRKSADWRTAREVTDRLATFDPADPIRYDFALCRLGILDQCSRRRRKEHCDACLLRDVCRFPVTR